MSCKAARFDSEEGRYYCIISESQCMYLIPNSESCARDYKEGPDYDDGWDNEEWENYQ